jgi:hypothetical protein
MEMSAFQVSTERRLDILNAKNDDVHLTRKCEYWPVELAEKLLTSPLSWGPPAYALGIGYIGDPKQLDQSSDFFELARCVDGAYERHGGDMGEAWNWANSIIKNMKERGSSAQYTTQDLLDIVFLHSRGERFSDGLIRSAEPILRNIVQEVVRRVHSSSSPVFLVQKE